MNTPVRSRRAAAAALLGLAATLALPGALAQSAASYPSKPIRLVVPFPAGDPPDLYARALADRLAVQLGQPVLIDNKPGAAGGIGAADIAKAPPDGYNLLFASAAMMTITPQLRKTPYDPTKDFEPIGSATTGVLMLSVNKAFPANNWPEFVAEVKRNPRKYTVFSSGEGSFLHLAAMHLQSVAGLELLHVPYKTLGQGFADQLAGLVNVSLEMSGALPHVRAGALKPLLVMDTKPTPELPNVPSLREHPLKYDLKPWFGVVAPAGTPKPIVERVQAAMSRVVPNDPQFREKLPAGTFPMWLGGSDFTAMMEADRAAYGAVIKRLNLKLD